MSSSSSCSSLATSAYKVKQIGTYLNLKPPLVLIHNLLLQPLPLAKSLLHFLLLLPLNSLIMLVLYDLLHLRILELLLVLLLLDNIESLSFLVFQSICFVFSLQLSFLFPFLQFILGMIPQFLVFLRLQFPVSCFLILPVSLLPLLLIIPKFHFLHIRCFFLGLLNLLPGLFLFRFEESDSICEQFHIFLCSFPAHSWID